MSDDKKKGQEESSAVYDLTFILPFLEIDSDDPADWTDAQVENFEALVKKAGEEITSDTIPSNSPAGKYRKKIYDEFKAGLQAVVERFKDAGNGNRSKIFSICRWLLWSLGWDDTKIDNEGNDYGVHQQNRDWIESEFREQIREQPSQNQAVIKVKTLYKKKFGFPIGKTTILRIVGRAD